MVPHHFGLCTPGLLAYHPPPLKCGGLPLEGRTIPIPSLQDKRGGGADLPQVSITLPLDNPCLLDAHRDLYPFAHMTREAQDQVGGRLPPGGGASNV